MIYKRLFQEKTLSLSEAKDFCLFIDTSVSGYINFVLYDQKILNENLIGLDMIPPIEKIKNIFKFKFYEAIMANINISTGKDNPGVKIPKMAYTIQSTSAKPDSGAGVLLYDIVMSWVTNKGKFLTPDRQSISNLAQKVWKYYFTKRKDVKHIPIDDIKNPVTKDKTDDGDLYIGNNISDEDIDYKHRNFSNHMYQIKKPLNYLPLIKNNKSLLNDLKKKKINNKVIDYLSQSMDLVSSKFFSIQYQRAS